MEYSTIRFLSLALLLTVLTACGGSDNNADAPQPDNSDPGSTESGSADNGNPDTGAAFSTQGVTGTVNGVTYQYTGDLRYTSQDNKRSITVESLEDGTDSWSINLLTPEEGTYSCGAESVAVVLTREGTTLDSSTDQGGCSITITSADSMGLAGYFTATLVDASGATQHSVTDGEFKVVFEDAIMDIDHDGFSDADDNCPFDANPDQLDDNMNRVGNICET